MIQILKKVKYNNDNKLNIYKVRLIPPLYLEHVLFILHIDAAEKCSYNNFKIIICRIL